jgi:hypothetical protein
MRRLLLASLLSLGTSALAGEVSTAEVAKIQTEQAAAAAAIDEKYQGKTSAADLKAMTKEKAAAERAVLESHGVSPAAFIKASTQLSRDERAELDAEKKTLKAKQDDAKKGKSGKADAKVAVEKGAGADQDRNEAAEMDRQMGLGAGKK